MKEKVLTLPTPFGAPLELYKNTWGNPNNEALALVSGLHGDHLQGIHLNLQLAQFLDSVVEGSHPDYTLKGQVISFPVVNLNAIQCGSRLAPADGMDMNLAFPGNPQGETTEALASAIMTHTAECYWGLILQSAPPHYEDAPHIQTLQLDSSTKKLCRNLKLETVRQLKPSPAHKVSLAYQWQQHDILTAILSSGSPRTVNIEQYEILFQSIVHFMKAEGLLKDRRKIKTNTTTKPHFYPPENDVSIFAHTAGMFLKEVKVGTHIEKGQTIGEIRDLYSGKRLEEIIAPTEGFLLTLRQYPIVYEKEPLATLLTAKKSWRNILPWSK